MHLSRLHLDQFRVYRELDLSLPASGVRIVGPNGSGKSSVVEAIAFLSTTRSPRASSDRELIRWGSGIDFGVAPYARCLGTIGDAVDGTPIEITVEAPVQVGSDEPGAIAGTVKKRVLLGGRPVRALDVVGRLRTVSFSPEDVAIVSGPPGGRRRLVDMALSQVDREYLRALSRYNRVMSQRNGLLKGFARDGVSPGSGAARSELLFWDDELVDAGALIVAGRQRFVAMLASSAEERYAQLAGGARFSLSYLCNVDDQSASKGGGVGDAADGDWLLDPAAIAERFRAGLARRLPDEFRRGVTLVGPHRDDLRMSLDGADLAVFGSRGQQRLGILSVKLAEADAIRGAGVPPVMLLDDVLSELDPERGRLLVETIAGFGTQVVVTATDRTSLDAGSLSDLPLLQSGNGTLRA